MNDHQKGTDDTIQRLKDKLEPTKHVTQSDEKKDAERSTRAVATGSPTDTSAERIKKFLQEVKHSVVK